MNPPLFYKTKPYSLCLPFLQKINKTVLITFLLKTIGCGVLYYCLYNSFPRNAHYLFSTLKRISLQTFSSSVKTLPLTLAKLAPNMFFGQNYYMQEMLKNFKNISYILGLFWNIWKIMKWAWKFVSVPGIVYFVSFISDGKLQYYNAITQRIESTVYEKHWPI